MPPHPQSFFHRRHESLDSAPWRRESRLLRIGSRTSTHASIVISQRSSIMNAQSLPSGQTALVTGASRGIGRASALALARAGAQVLVHYGNAEAEAAAVVDQIRAAGGK